MCGTFRRERTTPFNSFSKGCGIWISAAAFPLERPAIRVERLPPDWLRKVFATRRCEITESCLGKLRWMVGVYQGCDSIPEMRDAIVRCEAHVNEQRAFLLSPIEEQSDLTLEEIRLRLLERDVVVCVAAIWRFFDRNGISFKKTRARRRAGQARRGGRAPAMAAGPASV